MTTEILTAPTTAPPALPRGYAVFVARCATVECRTQFRLSLPTRGDRPVMATPLGVAWVPLMPMGSSGRNLVHGSHDWARREGLLGLALTCPDHYLSMYLAEATGHLRPATACTGVCWKAKHRVCACACGGARHGESRDTRRA